MPGFSVWLTVEGGEKIAKDLKDPNLLRPLRDAYEKGTYLTEREVKTRTPRDTSVLASSIKSTIDPQPVPLWGKVATDVKYAIFVEKGTRPHFPPMRALEGWAHRHGIPTFLAARAIAEKGTKAHKMFEKGFEAVRDKIIGFFEAACKTIEGKWGR